MLDINKKVIKKNKTTRKKNKLQALRENSAGIDIGAKSHFVSVGDKNVREFSTFTADLHKIASWLLECGIETVAMESTGVYWIPLYEILEENGFEVFLVNSQHVKNAPGRKTDVLDCQWLQQLHTYGLLKNSFRPKENNLKLRSYCRQRAMLINKSSSSVLHMQKTLTLMNVQLNNIIREVTGLTGMSILRDIVKGERDPEVLAKHRDRRCKSDEKLFAKSLEGNYQDEHVFALKQAIDSYDFINEQIKECEKLIWEILHAVEEDQIKKRNGVVNPVSDITSLKIDYNIRVGRRLRRHEFPFNAESCLERVTGTKLTAIPGLGEAGALMIISEIGLDMTCWKNSKHFSSWIGLCPKNKVSGGRILSSRTRPGSARIGWILRMCACSLHNSKTALGAHLRRLKSRIGAPKAITALAHKLARILYNMLKYGGEYVEKTQIEYEERYQERRLKGLKKSASELGYTLCAT